MGSACCNRLETQYRLEKHINNDGFTQDSKIYSGSIKISSDEMIHLVQAHPQDNKKIHKLCKGMILSGLPSVRTVNFSFTILSISDFSFIESILPCLQNLSCLNLWKCQLGSEGAKLIATSLTGVNSLKALYLQDNHIGDEGSSYLSRGFLFTPALQTLCIGCNNIGPEGARSISKCIDSLQYLQLLSIGENPIGDTGLLHIIHPILRLRKLNYIEITYADLSTDSGPILYSSLLQLPAIRTVLLYGNSFSHGTQALFLTNFQSLNLSV